MWYPNRLQWRVIWTLTAFVTLLGLLGLFKGGGGWLLVSALLDAAVLVWWFQRHGN